MSIQITPQILADVVTLLLTKQVESGNLDTDLQFNSFFKDIAEVVCNHCGGEVVVPASPLKGGSSIMIADNESLPEDGGVWKIWT